MRHGHNSTLMNGRGLQMTELKVKYEVPGTHRWKLVEDGLYVVVFNLEYVGMRHYENIETTESVKWVVTEENVVTADIGFSTIII